MKTGDKVILMSLINNYKNYESLPNSDCIARCYNLKEGHYLSVEEQKDIVRRFEKHKSLSFFDKLLCVTLCIFLYLYPVAAITAALVLSVCSFWYPKLAIVVLILVLLSQYGFSKIRT